MCVLRARPNQSGRDDSRHSANCEGIIDTAPGIALDELFPSAWYYIERDANNPLEPITAPQALAPTDARSL